MYEPCWSRSLSSFRGPFLSGNGTGPPREVTVEVAPIRQENAGDSDDSDDVSGDHLLEGESAYSHGQHRPG